MKNIPVFTTSAGVATVILREIPYWGKAYILPRGAFSSMEALIGECAAFCRNAGAERVFAKLDAPIPGARFSCEIWELRRSKAGLSAGTLPLTPLSPENEADFRALYNRRFAEVDNAAYCGAEEIASYLRDGGGWLYYDAQGRPVGLGLVRGSELCAIASDVPGLGYELALSLLEQCPGPELSLTVSSGNAPALRLYERLGFEKTAVRSRWYEV